MFLRSNATSPRTYRVPHGHTVSRQYMRLALHGARSNPREMNFSIIDLFVAASIVACSYYLIRDEGAVKRYGPEHDSEVTNDSLEDDDASATTIAIGESAHEVRQCIATGMSASKLVVDLALSGSVFIEPGDEENFGDTLLDRLFQVN